ncbi:MAG: indole-3-glycerol-phosphate synthase [bacterium]|nr:indole-3-glycerol-phosphate synthase [bacterium]
MSTPERLTPILQVVAQRAAERRRVLPLASLRAAIQDLPDLCGIFQAALSGPGLSIIAECKRRAPSTGVLCEVASLEQRIQDYEKGGADALSILTEQDHFSGSLADLSCAPAVSLPRIRKDFILDEAMILEARIGGAHAVLLIAACLEPQKLVELRGVAKGVGLGVLVEAHNAEELQVALALDPEMIGINARDLTTFETDLSVPEQLIPQIPSHILSVAESGMHNLEDLQRMRRAGAHAALIGTALMRAKDPSQTLCEWKGALGE